MLSSSADYSRVRTGPKDQVLPCEKLIFVINLVAGTECWPAKVVPRIQTGLICVTSPRDWSPKILLDPSCEQYVTVGLRPDGNEPIADQYLSFHNYERSRLKIS